MRRRAFLALIGGAAALAPLPVRAQQQPAAPPRVGLVSIGADPGNPAIFGPFLEQMRQLGYVDGENIVFERRFAGGRRELVDGFTADLVDRKVNVIVVTGQGESIAARQATSSIPIVGLVNPDPIGLGLAQSLSRPGGNFTGLTTMELDLYSKRIEILKEAIPGLGRAALLVSRGNPSYRRDSAWARQVEAAGRSLGIDVELVETEPDGVETVIAAVAANGAEGLLGASDGLVVARRKEIAAAAIRHRLPTVFAFRLNAEAGGLISYSAKVADLSRRAAFFVDRILKGANPANLPIEQASTFELVINGRTAKALGLTIPDSLLARADEVIE
jgi:putative tryptophan/tyrosine transport system substrate-binding protein